MQLLSNLPDSVRYFPIWNKQYKSHMPMSFWHIPIPIVKWTLLKVSPMDATATTA